MSETCILAIIAGVVTIAGAYFAYLTYKTKKNGGK